MRLTKSHLVSLAVLVVAVVVTSATTGSAAQTTKPRPTVSVSGSAPVTVTGFGFVPRERVTVRLVVGGDPASRVTRATARGRVAVQFPNVTLPDECSALSVLVMATGNRSGPTAVRRTIPPPCGYSPQP